MHAMQHFITCIKYSVPLKLSVMYCTHSFLHYNFDFT